jgi:hypothetical protein
MGLPLQQTVKDRGDLRLTAAEVGNFLLQFQEAHTDRRDVALDHALLAPMTRRVRELFAVFNKQRADVGRHAWCSGLLSQVSEVIVERSSGILDSLRPDGDLIDFRQEIA